MGEETELMLSVACIIVTGFSKIPQIFELYRFSQQASPATVFRRDSILRSLTHCSSTWSIHFSSPRSSFFSFLPDVSPPQPQLPFNTSLAIFFSPPSSVL